MGAGNRVGPNRPDTKENREGVVTERGAVIGAGATLLPRIRIGCDALVGAGGRVVKDVPAGRVVVGNPARIIR
jgi:acetyltransferase-like isoleucine patch superfamily enzyme